MGSTNPLRLGIQGQEQKMKFFNVTYSNTSRNSVQGLTIRTTEMSDRDIIKAAHAECAKQGEALETLAGIEWVEQTDGNFKPSRVWAEGEELAAAVEKLSDDGRMFEIAAQ